MKLPLWMNPVNMEDILEPRKKWVLKERLLSDQTARRLRAPSVKASNSSRLMMIDHIAEVVEKLIDRHPSFNVVWDSKTRCTVYHGNIPIYEFWVEQVDSGAIK